MDRLCILDFYSTSDEVSQSNALVLISFHHDAPYLSPRLTSGHLNSRNVSVSWKTTFPSFITATFNTFGRLGASGICGAGAGLDQWATFFNRKGLQLPLDSLDNGFFGRGI